MDKNRQIWKEIDRFGHQWIDFDKKRYSGGKNKPAKPCFPYKTDIFESHFRDKIIKELLSSFKGQSKSIK